MKVFVSSKWWSVGEGRLQTHKSSKNCQRSFSRFLLVEAEAVEVEAEALGVEADAEAVEK